MFGGCAKQLSELRLIEISNASVVMSNSAWCGTGELWIMLRQNSWEADLILHSLLLGDIVVLVTVVI
ncbi:MAG: hypothetical protein ACKERG_02625 [Candidatus Hodgkinia cicadicola]